MARREDGLDRLVGGAVFADTDGVVGEHVDHTQFTQGRQAHRAAHVVGEHQEGAAVGDQAAVVVRDSVEDGRHGVLTHAEVQVALLGGFRLVGAGLALDVGVVGVGEVSGATDQLRQVRSEGTQADLGVLAGGESFSSGPAVGRSLSQPSGSSPRSIRSNSAASAGNWVR